MYAIAFNNPYGDKVTSAVNAAVGGRILPSRASHDQAAAPFPTLLPCAARRSLRVLSTRRRRYGTRKRVAAAHFARTRNRDCLPVVRSEWRNRSDGSMDSTAKLWDVTRGVEVASLAGHTAEIVSLNFNTAGDRIITGSFDHTTKVWDTATGRCLHTLAGHRGEISSTQFDFSGELCISGSIDRTCKIWNAVGAVH